MDKMPIREFDKVIEAIINLEKNPLPPVSLPKIILPPKN
jgi:hypothetical protein